MKSFNTIEKMALDALPINDDEWGSERQTDACNAFFLALEACLPKCYFEEVEDYAMKATTEEMVFYGIDMLRKHNHKYAQFVASGRRTHNLAAITGMTEDTEGFIYLDSFYINFIPGDENGPDEYWVLIGNGECVFDNIDSAEWHLWSQFAAEQLWVNVLREVV
jgi:hypothetical protein